MEILAQQQYGLWVAPSLMRQDRTVFGRRRSRQQRAGVSAVARAVQTDAVFYFFFCFSLLRVDTLYTRRRVAEAITIFWLGRQHQHPRTRNNLLSYMFTTLRTVVHARTTGTHYYVYLWYVCAVRLKGHYKYCASIETIDECTGFSNSVSYESYFEPLFDT